MRSCRDLVNDQKNDILQKLITLLKFPSVSADPAFKDSLQACADWLTGYLSGMGAKVSQITDYGRPVVFAEFLIDPKLPTVLLYGHYDVQPAADLEMWQQDPFNPLIQGRKLIARGAADNKGTFMPFLAAIELLQKVKPLPLNIKIVLEGEEESTGKALFDFVEKQSERLKCDLVLSTDAGGFIPGKPAITYATRGLVYKQIDLYGPIQDLHSGSFGGAVQNPANALALMLGSLFDAHGHINIPGVYDQVRPIEPDERRGFAELEFNEKEYCKGLGISQTIHEPEFSIIEQLWCRPNLTINGLLSGYTGEGAKTVLPARATAKLSLRLVPDQVPQKMSDLLDAHLKNICPPGIRMEITTLGLAEPYLGPRKGPAAQAAAAAIEKAFGNRPAFIREGGSIPIMEHFKKFINENILILGLGRPDSGAHGPNEYMHLDDFEKGIEMACALYEELADNLGHK
jgi:acetylornithine deacetylase/succinyl-diaminopimelate desuccinylase-like protein